MVATWPSSSYSTSSLMARLSRRGQQAEDEGGDADDGHADRERQEVGRSRELLRAPGGETPTRVPAREQVADHPEGEDRDAHRDVRTLEPVQRQPAHHDEPAA